MTALNQGNGFSTTGKYASGLGTAGAAADNNYIKCIHAFSTIGNVLICLLAYCGQFWAYCKGMAQ